jgi:hypothetical protein
MSCLYSLLRVVHIIVHWLPVIWDVMLFHVGWMCWSILCGKSSFCLVDWLGCCLLSSRPTTTKGPEFWQRWETLGKHTIGPSLGANHKAQRNVNFSYHPGRDPSWSILPKRRVKSQNPFWRAFCWQGHPSCSSHQQYWYFLRETMPALYLPVFGFTVDAARWDSTVPLMFWTKDDG